MMNQIARLGVNVDHIATLRELRGTPYPQLLEVVDLCTKNGAKQITVHLREDRRHIQDQDVILLKKYLKVPLNLEMAITPQMVKFALKVKPAWVCLVPEKRHEVTTEGGLNLKNHQKKLRKLIPLFKKAKIKVSFFVDPTSEAIQLSHLLQADAVEIHVGKYCNATQNAYGKKSKSIEKSEFKKILKVALLAKSLGLKVHAGHGIDYLNIRSLNQINRDHFLIEEYNIGHAIVCRSVEVGMQRAVREMLSAIEAP